MHDFCRHRGTMCNGTSFFWSYPSSAYRSVIGTINVADKNMTSRIAPCLNALENKIEHASTLSCCRIEDACDERRSEQNSCRKTATPLSTPHWPTYAASLIGGRFLLMSGVIVLHLSFTATNYAYANDFDDAPQVKALAIGMPQDIAFLSPGLPNATTGLGKSPTIKIEPITLGMLLRKLVVRIWLAKK